MNPSRTLVVVPAFNEEETVASVVTGILARGLDVVVVDDGSADRTYDRAVKGGAKVLRLPFNLGVGGALRTGFAYAICNGYDTVVQCDADGQHDPAELHNLINSAAEADAHLVIGSRFGSCSGFKATRLRRIPMRLLARIATRAAGVPITDATSGFRVIREPLLSEFASEYPVHYLGDTFEVLVLAGRQRYRIREVAITMRPRVGGVPSAGPTASLRFLLRVLLVLLIGSGHKYSTYMEIEQ